jgi:hypothetical protein
MHVQLRKNDILLIILYFGSDISYESGCDVNNEMHLEQGLCGSVDIPEMTNNWKIFSIMCVPLSLMLREEHRWIISGSRVLRRKFESKRDELTGGWRNLFNELTN